VKAGYAYRSLSPRPQISFDLPDGNEDSDNLMRYPDQGRWWTWGVERLLAGIGLV